jgi:transcriptional regulator with XRE-family HTH domain
MNTAEIMDEIMKRLVLARKRAGLSQGQAAKLVGLDFAFVIEEYEAGQGDLTLSRFLKLCDIYGVSPVWALTGVNPDFDAASVLEVMGRVTEDSAAILDILSSLHQAGQHAVLMLTPRDDLDEIRGPFYGDDD